MRRESRVAIYERVKFGDKWGRKKVKLPPLKRDGKLFLKDDRQGIFQLSWYEARRKQWQNVKGRVSDRELPYLSDALSQAEDQSRFLNNPHSQVVGPTNDGIARKKLTLEAALYLEAKSGCKKTVGAHKQAVVEFQQWAIKAKKGRGIIFVDEITKPVLRRFYDYLVDGDEDEDGPANCPFTAAFKVMRVNSFVRCWR
jgi:hypothetical protein